MNVIRLGIKHIETPFSLILDQKPLNFGAFWSNFDIGQNSVSSASGKCDKHDEMGSYMNWRK